jgi:Na+:H+ antiporter, NhaA family
MILEKLKEFLKLEASGGIILFVAGIFAMIIANTHYSNYYENFLNTPVVFSFGTFELAKPFYLWINDGLMAIFFFLIGLELKREFLAGELSEPSKVVLPVVAAIGGMLVPAAIYAYINWGNEEAIRGWAIPSATDIAFALGVLALLGSRVPVALKVFLATLAIIDDMGAIIIIAIFYTHDLSIVSLIVALVAITVLYSMNKRNVLSIAPYLFVGLIFWVAVLKSGVHATLAGVITALFIPYRKQKPGHTLTLLERLEHDLHPSVSYAILPLFAFANSGVSLSGVTFDSLLHPVPLGIALGLFVGKQIGVMLFSWLTIRFGFAKLPTDSNWLQLYGVSILCGIGFTMSLFIGTLAFDPSSANNIDPRLGILIGSILSGVIGYLLLKKAI